MQIMSLITALPGAAAQGLIWGIMAIGVYITFRILDIADLTVDGTLCTGGAVCIMMMLSAYQTNARTSPPTPSSLACLSVITPWLVEMIATPKPPSTFGISSLFA